MLGDASLAFKSSGYGWRHPVLRFQHGAKQAVYCIHKATNFMEFANRLPKIRPNSGWGDEVCRFDTVRCPALDFAIPICLRHIPGKTFLQKTVTQSWLDLLTWEGIAYWYMDDGSLDCQLAVTISTHGFSKEENYLLASWLGTKGIDTRVQRMDRGDKTYYYLRMDRAHSLLFIEKVKPYIHPSMAYKIAIKPEKLAVCAMCGCEFSAKTCAAKAKIPCCPAKECKIFRSEITGYPIDTRTSRDRIRDPVKIMGYKLAAKARKKALLLCQMPVPASARGTERLVSVG